MSNFDPSIAAKYTKLRSDLDAHTAAVHAEIKVEARKVIEAVGAEFFARNPSVVAIRWTQYTPYWQDGDTCTFGANDPELQLFSTDEDEDSERYFDGHQGLLRRKNYHIEEIAEIETEIAAGPTAETTRRHWHRRTRDQSDIDNAKAEIAKIDAKIEKAGGVEAYSKIVADFEVAAGIIKSIKDTDLEIVFDDHVQVFITKDGVTVEEYEHD
jgi:hypothetical protein